MRDIIKMKMENTTGPDVDLCYHCGGKVSRVAGQGRIYKHRGVDYALPEDLALAICEQCGGYWLNCFDTKAITDVIEVHQSKG